MKTRIDKPHIPSGNVCAAVCSAKNKALSDELSKLGIDVVTTANEPQINGATADHADMLCLPLSSTDFAVSANQPQIALALKEAGYDVIECALGSKYPTDCALNALWAGELLISNERSLSAAVRHYCTRKGATRLNVKQGYTKCSCALVSSDAFITADRTIYNVLTANGFDCLLIPQGEIALEGFDYGFIGGSCFLASASLLAFTGSLKTVSYAQDIISFCRNHNVYTSSLTDERLFDIGGVVPFLQTVQ